MWFEADLPFYSPSNQIKLGDVEYTLPWQSSGLSAALASLPWASEQDSVLNQRSADDWAEIEGLFAPMTTVTEQWGTEKDGDTVMSDETIVVTGRRTIRLDTVSWADSGPPDLFWTVHMDGGGSGYEGPAGGDASAIDIQIAFDRPLTESEAQALENLKATIAALTKAINELADNATLTLPNGATVTGATMKSIWANTDFIINDNLTYGNGTIGGEAVMAFGQPTIQLNIQYLDSYDDFVGGMNYLVAHELGHLTQASISVYRADELVANDIARALLNGSGLAYLNEPDRYTPGAPTQFSVTPPATGDGGGGEPGGGGGGGSGGNGDYIP